MSFVLRTWLCLAPRCRLEFDSGEMQPACPECGSLRVQWVPKGANIRHATTTHADRTLRQIAETHGLTDLRSARAGEAAHPGLRQPKTHDRLFHGIPWAPEGAATAGFAKPGTRPTGQVKPVAGERFAGQRSGPPTRIARTPDNRPMIDGRKIPV